MKFAMVTYRQAFDKLNSNAKFDRDTRDHAEADRVRDAGGVCVF